MSKFTHEGIDIILNASGKFVATISGNTVEKDTLSAMKKAIDNDKQSGFSKFTVVGSHRYGGQKIPGLKEHTRLTIIGVRTEKRRNYSSRKRWISEDGSVIEHDDVYKDCPEMIELLKQEEEIRGRNQAAEDLFNKEIKASVKKQEKYIIQPE